MKQVIVAICAALTLSACEVPPAHVGDEELTLRTFKRLSDQGQREFTKEEFEEAYVEVFLQENVRRGFMKEIEPGRYVLTRAGMRYVEGLMRGRTT